ncbi:MAG: 2-amino-4-hydroxy-6-hydroxymethyldihydropteridine diphosphokinase [Armatimonadetes bacterium]|nr:2-amino-4-hydroxy-6-hydroxymethyldihydropteridine diphosphokinase [Armatimonadota bacterium]
MIQAIIAFGSNIGDPIANIKAAEQELSHHVTMLRQSSFYQTAPMYLEDQPDFINGCWLVQTDLGPRALLSLLKSIEARLGRAVGPRNSPRPIDLDLILYGFLHYDFTDPEFPKLQIPHPRYRERRFVVEPMIELGVLDLGAFGPELMGQRADRLPTPPNFSAPNPS